MEIHRISIEDVLPGVLADDDLPGMPGKVKALSAVKSIAVALDQFVNRAQDDLNRYGALDLGTRTMADEVFADVRNNVRVLEAGAAAGRAMLAAVAQQVGVPTQAASPKKANGGKDK